MALYNRIRYRVATIFRIPIRKALPALLIGVLIAGAIVTAVSCGVISLWV